MTDEIKPSRSILGTWTSQVVAGLVGAAATATVGFLLWLGGVISDFALSMTADKLMEKVTVFQSEAVIVAESDTNKNAVATASCSVGKIVGGTCYVKSGGDGLMKGELLDVAARSYQCTAAAPAHLSLPVIVAAQATCIKISK